MTDCDPSDDTLIIDATTVLVETKPPSKPKSRLITRRKGWVFGIIALILAALFTSTQITHRDYNQTLIDIQAQSQLGYLGSNLDHQPTEIQAQLIDYAPDQTLTLQAWLALREYPQQTPSILAQYGQDPEFQQILKRHGPAIMPVIAYFMTHKIASLEAIHASHQVVANLSQKTQTYWHKLTGNPPPTSTDNKPSDKSEYAALTPEQRGWMAIAFIQQEGDHFLGQFDIDSQGEAHWNQTDRITQVIGRFLTSGISTLERKSALDEPINASDIGWVAADALPLVVGVKILAIGKTGVHLTREGETLSRATKSVTKMTREERAFSKIGLVERTGILARNLAPRWLKDAAWLATAYIIVRHPALLSSLFSQIGRPLGLPAWLSQTLGWGSLIYLLLFPFVWLLEKLIKPIVWFLGWLSVPLSSHSPQSR